jgi:hypothetical protein
MQPAIPPTPVPPTVIVKDNAEVSHVDVRRPVLAEPSRVVHFKRATIVAFSLACP